MKEDRFLQINTELDILKNKLRIIKLEIQERQTIVTALAERIVCLEVELKSDINAAADQGDSGAM